MARTVVAVMQTPWDCRWSRPGHRLIGVDEDHQPEGRWVCTRSMPDGSRRSVTDEDCATCAHWEAEDTPVPSAFPAPRFSLRAVSERATPPWQRILFAGLGVALVAMGIGLAATLVMLPVGVAFVVAGGGVLASDAAESPRSGGSSCRM